MTRVPVPVYRYIYTRIIPATVLPTGNQPKRKFPAGFSQFCNSNSYFVQSKNFSSLNTAVAVY